MTIDPDVIREFEYAYGVTDVKMEFMDHHRTLAIAITLPDGSRKAFRASFGAEFDFTLQQLWEAKRT
jgi:hypothetical protein